MQTEINVLTGESNEKTDENNRLKETIDDLNEQITSFKEQAVKDKNANDCLKEMVTHLQTVMQKHESENT